MTDENYNKYFYILPLEKKLLIYYISKLKQSNIKI